MSVSRNIKTEIIEQTYKSVCCRRSLLSGILFAKGKAEGKCIELVLERVEYGDFAMKLIKEFYGQDGEMFRTENGGRRIVVSFNSPSAAKYISNINEKGELNLLDLIQQKCAGCLSAFLKGVFLASGRLSDPKKQFSLDFAIGNRCNIFASVLQDLSLEPHLSDAKGRESVYFRRADNIEDFFGYAGINGVVFDIIEKKITSLARRESQRYLNCVTSNYDKMAAVSKRQIGIISRLEDLQLLSTLPDELQETARLKLRYPDLPLSSLAAQMTPAISKSGISHRLKKIEEIGAKLLKLTDE